MAAFGYAFALLPFALTAAIVAALVVVSIKGFQTVGVRFWLLIATGLVTAVAVAVLVNIVHNT